MAGSSQVKVQVVKERTHREAIRFSLEWTIDNFSTFQNQTHAMYGSGITIQDLGDAVAKDYQGRWRIRVIPCHKITEDSVETKYLSAFLWLTDSSTESQSYTGEEIGAEFHARVTTGKATVTDVVTFTAPGSYHVFKGGNRWGYNKLVTHRRLLGVENEPGLIKDDCITVGMDVVMYQKPKTVSLSEISKPVRLVDEFTRRQLEWFRAKHRRQFSDFILVSNDSREFPVHRFVLMAHSPVFEAMFTHNLKEKQLSRCELKDFDGKTVEMLLDYVYGCDIANIKRGNAETVLIMADKYEMMDLRAACELILAKDIPVEKAVHYLVLASQRGLTKLMDATLDVLSKNKGTLRNDGGLDELIQFDPLLLVTIMEYS